MLAQGTPRLGLFALIRSGLAPAAASTCSVSFSGLLAATSVRLPVALGDAGKEHVPEPHRDTVKCRVTEWQVISAAHPGLTIGDPLRVRPPRRDAEHLSRKVGQDDVSPRREPGHGQPRLARARGNVEMPLITGDAQTPDHRRANRAQLIHDDRVPLLPARRKPGPRRSLNISDLIAARHRPSRYQTHPPNPKALPGGST